MDKRNIVRSVIVVLVMAVFALPALAGTVYTNDAGGVAKAFRVVLSEPVEITSFGGAFTVQAPEGKASEFVFSGGEAKEWDSFWLSWTPQSATVVKSKWLADVPVAFLSDVTKIAVDKTETAKEIPVQLTSTGVTTAGTTSSDLTLIDDFNNPAHSSSIGGQYDYGTSDMKGNNPPPCKISWENDGPGKGHIRFDYTYSTWMKFGLDSIPGFDACEEKGIALTIWGSSNDAVHIEVGVSRGGQWYGYLSPDFQISDAPRTFHIPFTDFHSYDNPAKTGIPRDYLASLTGITVFPNSHQGTLYLDDLALYHKQVLGSSSGGGASPKLTGNITRHISYEKIPFSIRYGTDLDSQGLAFQWRVYFGHRDTAGYVVVKQTIATSNEPNPTFILDSNADTYEVELTITDEQGRTYRWQDKDIDIPLHSKTAITLNATKFVPEQENQEPCGKTTGYEKSQQL